MLMRLLVRGRLMQVRERQCFFFFVLIVDVMYMFFFFSVLFLLFGGRPSGEHLCHDLFLFRHRNTPNTYLLIDLFKLAGMMLI